MTMPHTPAPWFATIRDGTLKVRGPETAKSYKQREICRCYGANRSDVDLIVAAPDLLAACKRLVENVRPCHFAKGVDGKEYHLLSDGTLGATRGECMFCAARAAIAKAEKH